MLCFPLVMTKYVVVWTMSYAVKQVEMYGTYWALTLKIVIDEEMYFDFASLRHHDGQKQNDYWLLWRLNWCFRSSFYFGKVDPCTICKATISTGVATCHPRLIGEKLRTLKKSTNSMYYLKDI